jgi:UDP-N-acetylmuramate dehydrogenase
MTWPKSLKNRVKAKVPLAQYTTLRIGGAAEFFFTPQDERDLRLGLAWARRNRLPFLVLGAGSNLLVSDKGVKAVVARLNSPHFTRADFSKEKVQAGSGIMLAELLKLAQGRGLSGLEFLAGIPGTLGGALRMNAGAWGVSIADLLEEVKVMDSAAKIKTLRKNQIKFAYRKSGLADKIIIGAKLRLKKSAPAAIRKNIRGYLARRRSSQDLTHPSAGCAFKNPFGQSAGWLMDCCGLKGKKIGRAAVSAKHANFIINTGKAKAKDILRLMDLARKTVRRRFQINLQPEIQIWQ